MSSEKKTSAKRIQTRTNILVHLILAILAVIWLFPVVWVVLTSFRAEKGSYVSSFLTKSFTLDNYIKLFTDTSILNFPQMFLNTLFIAICSCVLSAFFLLSASYCLSRLRFKLRKPYMNMAMILGLFPGFMSMVAVYFILKAVGLTEGNNVRFALILCYSGGAALGFQITKGFFDTIPKDLDEAAMLDGCSKAGILFKIMIPIVKPAIVTASIFAFYWIWQDFFQPLIFVSSPENYTIPLALNLYLDPNSYNNYGGLFAMSVVSLLPVIVVFILFQKYIVEGIATDGIKG